MSARGLPTHWSHRRLRFDVLTNPVKSELTLPDSTEVSFVPMDAVGEFGGLRLEDTKPLADVYTGYTYFRDGDLCIAKITPCFENGKGAIAEGLVNGVGFGTTELHVVRPQPSIDKKFLFYLSTAHDFRSLGEAEMLGAGGQKRVPEAFIKDWRAPLPSLDTQKRIAAFLDDETTRIDTLIAKKRALLERLAEKRQAIITEAVTKGLNSRAPMKDSGIDWLGQIPAHWSVELLGRSLQRIEQGWSPQCEERAKTEDEWGVLRSGCINNGVFRPEDHKTLPPDMEPRQNIEVCSGDLLFCRASGSVNLIGSAAVVEFCPPRLMFSDKTYRIVVDSTRAIVGFLSHALKSKYMRDQIVLSVSGAEGLANNIPQGKLKQYWLARPPVGEQEVIASYLSKQLGIADRSESRIGESIRLLQEYRAALITAAVTGQIEGLR